jgi:hypothetical protein
MNIVSDPIYLKPAARRAPLFYKEFKELGSGLDTRIGVRSRYYKNWGQV